MSDSVNKPSHYTSGGVECIDGIRAALGGSFADYCRGNVLKYVWRCGKKGDAVEDLRKAAKYLQWAIEEVESEKKPETLAIPEGWRELKPNETPLASDMYEHEETWMKRFEDANCEYEWYDVRHIRKIETEKPSEIQYDNHVEGVWVEEAGNIEPTEWIPDPGPGYRLLSKDPPERVVKGDEFWGLHGPWQKSDNWRTNGAQCSAYYRRKIEAAQ